MNIINYICKDCRCEFFIRKVNIFALIKGKEKEINCCPSCGGHSLFNQTFEEEIR